MKIGSRLTIVLFALCAFSFAHAQSDSTAARGLQLYGFGGLTAVETDIGGGTNGSFTAGVDLGYHVYYGLLPTIEARGTIPVDDGKVDSMKSLLGGLKVEKPINRFHPYIDFLYGRGEILYAGAGFLNPQQTTLYQRTNSNIYSIGGGLDFDITPAIALKVEAQAQHYVVPVTDDGTAAPVLATVGVLYRFGYHQNHIY